MALDYGSRRTGVAVTDILRIAPNGLPTIETKNIFSFLDNYFSQEIVDILVIGYPTHLDGSNTYVTIEVEGFIKTFSAKHPNIKIFRQSEWFTSRQAKQVIMQSGINKTKRRDKSLIDKISAVIILEEFMQSKDYLNFRDQV